MDRTWIPFRDTGFAHLNLKGHGLALFMTNILHEFLASQQKNNILLMVRGLILARSGNGEVWRCYQRSTQTALNFCPARSSKRVFAPASNLKQIRACLQ